MESINTNIFAMISYIYVLRINICNSNLVLTMVFQKKLAKVCVRWDKLRLGAEGRSPNLDEINHILGALQQARDCLLAHCGGVPGCLAPPGSERGEEAGRCQSPAHRRGRVYWSYQALPKTVDGPHARQRCIIQQQGAFRWWWWHLIYEYFCTTAKCTSRPHVILVRNSAFARINDHYVFWACSPYGRNQSLKQPFGSYCMNAECWTRADAGR